MVRKTVTLVFCDVADSTPLGEQLDPEALRAVWSRYHETARTVLERHGGTIEKFVGDAVLGVFGIPVVHEDDALRAVRAAVELRGELAGLNDELERAFGIRIGVRTGVHTGEVYAGDPAQGDPFATGDAVVVAQRLEATAAAGEILAGDATIRLVRDAVTVEPVPALELKGKSEPVDAWRLLDVEPEAAGLARRLDSPLVGRGPELDALLAELEQVLADRSCRIVTIVGEPGVGKSRLAAELVSLAGEGALVLEGRCLPYGSGITYWPLVEIVRDLDLDEILGADVAHGRILEAVGRAESRSRSDEIYSAVRRLLEALAATQPVVVVLVDIQWAEPAFLDLVEYLAGWSRDAPILVCCLARPDLAELRPAWGGVTIQLAPLPREHARTLLENLVGPLDQEAADAVGRATGGNPLFLEEVVRMLVEDGVLVQRHGRLEPMYSVDALPVPGTVQAVLAARLDRLDEAEQALLQRAAVMGQVFWWVAVADLSPAGEVGGVAGRLQALVRKGLIKPDARTFAGEDGFRFGHILIRDAAYEATPKRTRAELHERFASWVEQRAGERLDLDELLGHHLEQAYLYRVELAPAGPSERVLAKRAAERLARGGRRALVRADTNAAGNLLGRAVALLEPDSPQRLELLLDLGTAFQRGGELARALAALDELLAARPGPGLEWSARLERAFVEIYSGESSPENLLAVAERAADVFADLGDDGGLAKTWNAVGLEFFIRGRYAQMETAARTGLEHARGAADQQQEAASLSTVCVALPLGPTPVGLALPQCRELLERAAALGSMAVPAATLAALEGMRGNLAEAWQLYESAQDALADSGSLALAGLPLYAEALLALDPARAEAELRTSYASLLERGDRGVLPTIAAHLAEVLIDLGRLEEAEHFSRVGEELTGPSDVYTQVVWRRTLARSLRGRRGRRREQERFAQEAVDWARTTDSPHLVAKSLLAPNEVTGDAEALAEAAELWELKGHLSALAALDIPARAR